jgi:hypothetical protein
MTSLIKSWSTAAMIVGILGSAAPAFAQTAVSDAGVAPILLQGDQSPAAIAAACQIPFLPNRQIQLSPASPGGSNAFGFGAQIIVSGETIAFTDTSSPAPDQFNGTLGIEGVGVRRNGTYVYCYNDKVHDSRLDAPGSGSPNQVTLVWGPGPCPLDDATVAQVCAAYNPDPQQPTVDFIQGHQIKKNQPINLCGCESQVSFCDPSLPQGTPGACIPAGQSNVFQGSEPQNSATVGTGTCKQVALPTVGGSLRYTTVCN